MHTTSQERFALGVAVLLLAAGAGVRLATAPSPPPDWADVGGGEEASAAELEARVEREVEREERAATPLAAGERIDPNTASATELERLPRVGPRLAARIVEYRESNGPFRTLADLDAVPGIGPVLLEQMAPLLTLPAAPASPRSAPPERRASAARPQDRSPEVAPLDLNTATAEELERLPGIGPVLAERIIRWRTEHGPFRTVDELEQVPGIGPRLRERLALLVRAGS